jgi:predicted transcriptional regulator
LNKVDFKKAAILGSCLSKDYAESLFKLLVTYQSISASEAASRLNLHIKTVQDFLEALAEVDILEKEEAVEKKRPYYRYSLKTRRITMDLDLSHLFEATQPQGALSMKIREQKDAGARFSVSRDNQYISNVYIWTGQGRDRKERKINLSMPQGKFLFYLPFPSAKPETVQEIMKKAGVEEQHAGEVLDIVQELMEQGVIET